MGDNTQKKRIGEILIEDGCLSPESLQEALTHQKKEGGLIGQILIKLGYVSEESLVAAVSKQLSVPYIPLSQYSINMDAAVMFGEEFCRKHMLIVFDADDKRIYCAVSDPINDYFEEEIAQKSKLRTQVFISSPSEVFTMLDLIFSNAKNNLKKAG